MRSAIVVAVRMIRSRRLETMAQLPRLPDHRQRHSLHVKIEHARRKAIDVDVIELLDAFARTLQAITLAERLTPPSASAASASPASPPAASPRLARQLVADLAAANPPPLPSDQPPPSGTQPPSSDDTTDSDTPLASSPPAVTKNHVTRNAVTVKRGRPKSGNALSAAEKQRQYRLRKARTLLPNPPTK